MDSSGPDHVNAVVEVQPALTAPAKLQALDQGAGRQRSFRNALRTLNLNLNLDWDLLTCGQARIQSEQIMIPQPRAEDRAFVLVPLAEIAPHVVTAAALQAVRTQRISRLEKRLGVAGKR